MTTTPTTTTPTAAPGARKLPPVLGRLFSGTFWLALRAPLQAFFSLWTIPLILQAVGTDGLGAYGFAWGFGFLQFLLEFGMSSSLQRQVSETWTRGDRAGVDRSIACGMNFYAVMAMIQAATLLGVAYVVLPTMKFGESSHALIVKLLWLQAVTAPCYGLTVVVSSVLQAARRYEFIPRLEVAVVLLRFLVLWGGVNAGIDFFTIVACQTVVQVVPTLGPALWVMIRELGHRPHFRGAHRSDYRALMHISFYMFLIQLSVALADKIDTTVLGFALPFHGDAPEPGIAVYQVVSKPFIQIRQIGWMLAYMVMPAVASLVAARDDYGLERVKYDGMRLHISMLMPVALLAWIYASPFLTLWVGNRVGHDPAMLRLFLVAVIPVVLSVPVQAAIGMNRVKVISLAALGGSIVNLPLSFALTTMLGVSGVIWGTVLTTLFSNLLIPGLYVYRELNYRARTLLTRTFSPPLAGAAALIAATWLLQTIDPLHPSPVGGMSLTRWMPLIAHLAIGSVAYIAGYLLVPTGRKDLNEIAGKLIRR